ncbi:MAG: hypothetical protein Q4C83_00270 [Candidatus Saccharibacteria bacterium]|nr:hypothetical protein [Candidatus Saccharibacteria bacterium]
MSKKNKCIKRNQVEVVQCGRQAGKNLVMCVDINLNVAGREHLIEESMMMADLLGSAVRTMTWPHGEELKIESWLSTNGVYTVQFSVDMSISHCKSVDHISNLIAGVGELYNNTSELVNLYAVRWRDMKVDVTKKWPTGYCDIGSYDYMEAILTEWLLSTTRGYQYAFNTSALASLSYHDWCQYVYQVLSSSNWRVAIFGDFTSKQAGHAYVRLSVYLNTLLHQSKDGAEPMVRKWQLQSGAPIVSSYADSSIDDNMTVVCRLHNERYSTKMDAVALVAEAYLHAECSTWLRDIGIDYTGGALRLSLVNTCNRNDKVVESAESLVKVMDEICLGDINDRDVELAIEELLSPLRYDWRLSELQWSLNNRLGWSVDQFTPNYDVRDMPLFVDTVRSVTAGDVRKLLKRFSRDYDNVVQVAGHIGVIPDGDGHRELEIVLA